MIGGIDYLVGSFKQSNSFLSVFDQLVCAYIKENILIFY